MRALFWMLAFGALSALGGGVLGVAFNGAGVPLEYLQGTPFDSYIVPGLVLGLVIGGTQAAAAIAVGRRSRWALLLSSIAGAGMLIWIFVELAAINEYSPLQTAYFALGGAELATVFILLGILRPAINLPAVRGSGG
ncbi:MAG: hypothetical protein ABI566_10715 [Pseudolysinimonas sp.]